MTGNATESIADRSRRLIEPVLAREGYEVVEVEWLREGGRWILRLFIDKPVGITLDDCQNVSRTIEPMLDVEDFIEPAYSLEVSSPGVERPLRKPADFQRFAGKRAHLKAYGPVEGTDCGPTDPRRATAPHHGPRKNWTGVLHGFGDGLVEIDVDGRLHRVALDKIAKANLELELEPGNG